jgi:diguanylate cyclase
MASILLVDDHPDIVRLLQRFIEGEGHRTRAAYDGEQALALIAEEKPDLVVLDVVMPKLDGYRVLNRIKMDPALADIIVVMLSVKDEANDMMLGLDIGADYYLGKPFKPEDVTKLIQRILETHNNADPETGSAGTCE